MSRKRDTNWNRDEISVLLDSIIEITKTRVADGKRTNSRDVFDFTAKRMAEKGHPSRAERDKCRTKWKKMKEEFTHAKKAREGDTRYKEAPGIQPFYDRMEEFMNFNYDSGSPKSMIARRGSNVSSGRSSVGGMRTSARIAANTSGTTTSDNNDTSSTGEARTSLDYTSTAHTSSNASPSSGQNSSRPSSGGTNNSSNLPSSLSTNNSTSLPQHHNHNNGQPQQPNNQQPNSNGDLCTIYSTYSSSNNNNVNNNTSTASSTSVLSCVNDPLHSATADHADISYRVSTGCRQITIFGDHDVDIRFRGDCVTINKLDVDYPATDT